MQNKYGVLFGVGIGPGDPELITVKGLRVIKENRFIYMPADSPGSTGYAYSIAASLIDRDKHIVENLPFPMTNDMERLKMGWSDAADRIYTRLEKGENAVFITEGDPFLFSTFIYLYHTIKDRYPYIDIKVIPGITSFNAASCNAYIPLTDYNSDKVIILPACYHLKELKDLIDRFDTIILLKIKPVIKELLEMLNGLGNSVRITFVQRCSTVDEVICYDIEQIKGIDVGYMSLMIINNIKLQNPMSDL